MMKKLLLFVLIAVAREAMAEDAQCVRERAAMVETIRAYARSAGVLGPQGISESVLKAVGQTERHRFIPVGSCSVAYADMPVPIGQGQTISQPFIVALMTHLAELDLTNHTFSARSRDELEPAFDAMVKAGMQAVTINSEGLAYQQREFIANLAIARRLPLSVWSRETLEAGALMSYGADQVAMCRRAAVFVDKILKGANPADLPAEEPTKIEFLLNKKTAKALGLTFPNTLLVAATDVNE